MNLKFLCIAGIAMGCLCSASASIDTKQATKPPSKATAKPAPAPNAAKLEAIKQMLAISHTVDGNVAAAQESIKAMKKNSPTINPKFWDELSGAANHTAFEHLLVGIYDRAYTLDEIRGITKFYASPIGKAFLEKNGKTLQDSGHAMQAYMESHSKDLMKKYSQPAAKVEPKKK